MSSIAVSTSPMALSSSVLCRGVSDTRRLAVDVLLAMGKHYDAISRERQSRHGWDLARLWTRAERVPHLVAWDAHRLPTGLRNQLGVLAAEAGARLWMVVRADLAPR